VDFRGSIKPTSPIFTFSSFRVVRVKVFQAFLLSGGVNGRFAKGDELMEIEFMEGDDSEEMEHEVLEHHTVL
jgi:hypothetical protein